MMKGNSCKKRRKTLGAHASHMKKFGNDRSNFTDEENRDVENILSLSSSPHFLRNQDENIMRKKSSQRRRKGFRPPRLATTIVSKSENGAQKSRNLAPTPQHNQRIHILTPETTPLCFPGTQKDSFRGISPTSPPNQNASPVEYNNYTPNHDLSIEHFVPLKFSPLITTAYKYQGITHIFPWQKEALEIPSIGNPFFRNYIYSAPTGAGKTLVSELMMIRRLAAKLGHHKKVLYLVPFVTIAREKSTALRKLFKDTGITISCFAGDMPKKHHAFEEADVAVATFEQGIFLINNLLSDKKLGKIGTIIIDEIHLVADNKRGAPLEAVLATVAYLKKTLQLDIQMIGMSAALVNISDIAEWLDAESFQTTFRPIPLNIFTLVGTKLYKEDNFDKQPLRNLEITSKTKVSQFRYNIFQLSSESCANDMSTLIFVHERKSTESLAHAIFSNVRELKLYESKYSNRDVTLKEFCQNTSNGNTDIISNSPHLWRCIKRGVAYHHAGLKEEEKHCIESLFRERLILILCATSTLAAGVNLPAERVISKVERANRDILTPEQWLQMAGRAGRYGFQKIRPAEAILFVPENTLSELKSQNKSKRENAEKILQTIQRAQSRLLSRIHGSMLHKAVLDIVAQGVIEDTAGVVEYLKNTFAYKQMPEKFACDENGRDVIALKCISWLCENNFIKVQGSDIFATDLGLAALESGFKPSDALLVNRHLKNFNVLCLDGDLHLLSMIVPPEGVGLEFPKIPSTNIAEKLFEWISNWKEDSGGYKTAVLLNASPKHLSRFFRGCYRNIADFRRLYFALLLQDLAEGNSTDCTARKFGIKFRGDVVQIQKSCGYFAASLSRFVKALGKLNIHSLLKSLQGRFDSDVSDEMMHLMAIDGVTPSIAKALYKTGKETIKLVASSSIRDIYQILVVNEESRADTINPEESAIKIWRSAICIRKEEFIKMQLEQERFTGEMPEVTLKPYHLDDNCIIFEVNSTHMFKETVRLWQHSSQFSMTLSNKSFVEYPSHVYVSFESSPHVFSLPCYNSVEGDFCPEWKEMILPAIRKIVKTRQMITVGINVFLFLNKIGLYLNPNNYFDVSVASWLIDPTCSLIESKPNFGTKSVLENIYWLTESIPVPRLDFEKKKNAFTDAVRSTKEILNLYFTLNSRITKNGLEKAKKMEEKFSEVLAKLTQRGVGFDVNKCRLCMKVLKRSLEMIKNKTISYMKNYWIQNKKFNFDSTTDVQNAIKRFFPKEKISDSCKDTITRLKRIKKERFLFYVEDYRRISNLETMTRSMINLYDGESGRLYPSYNRFTYNGRCTTFKPDLQTLPRKKNVINENGLEIDLDIRDTIIAPKGKTLLAADYKQIELRFMAEFSGDMFLIKRLEDTSSNDIFCEIAAEIFQKHDVSSVCENERKRAKSLVYGLSYGLGINGIIAQFEDIAMSRHQATSLKNKFDSDFPLLKKWRNKILQDCTQTKNVTTLTGRKRYFREKECTGAKACNSVIQGSVADYVKSAMIKIEEELDENCIMILQVHDEILFEINTSVLAIYASKIRLCMESLARDFELQLNTPTKIMIGQSFGNMTEWVV